MNDMTDEIITILEKINVEDTEKLKQDAMSAIEKLKDGSDKEHAVNKYAVQSHGGEVNIAEGGSTENVAITGGVYAENNGYVNVGGAVAAVALTVPGLSGSLILFFYLYQ